MASRIKRPSRPRYTFVDVVEVYLWGELMGAVALDPRYGFYAFRYTPQFQATGIEPSPLYMPATADRTFLFTDLPVETYKRLPAMLADALPDDFGNALIDRWMLDHGVKREDITALDRLAYMNDRAMGALQFKPARGPGTRHAFAVKLNELVTAARKAVHGDFDGDDHAQAALRHIIEVGTSAGGARAKAVIAWNPQTEEIRSGQIEAPPGFEYWLLKFDGVGKDFELGASQDYGRIEYAYYLMARAAGIHISESRLLHENGRAHFMTRRFDREVGGARHHVQTLCAMAHLDFKKKGTNSYAQLFHTIERLGLPYEDKEEAFRRMVFNVMARNCDDHTKNFAFRLRQGHHWELAPAYDVTFAHNPRGEWTSQHLMSVNGKFTGFTEDDMLAEADRFAIGSARRIIKKVREAVVAWPDFATEAGVSAKEIERIGSLHLLLREGQAV
ncbi:MAG TPA: type II toxin-antitoxin system HipA family toxin [Candidatus Paceibacterota bacterium]|nr:type II toxin-antitoxin system HipA family toxin [Candidatus Paceibacterota bacterium]